MRKIKIPSLIHISVDALIIYVSFFVSLWLRTEELSHLTVLKNLAILFTAIRLATMVAFGVYDIIWRYISLEDSYKIMRSVFVSMIFMIAATYMVDLGVLPRSMFLIDGILVTLGLGGVRVLRRTIHQHFQNSDEKKAVSGSRRTLIIGAGDTGRLLAQRINNEPQFGCHVIGFVDNDPKKLGSTLAGHKILGKDSDLPKLIDDHAAQDIIVAIKHPTGDLLRSMVMVSKEKDVALKMVSGLDTSSGTRTGLLRSVDPQDLIKRKHVPMKSEGVEKLLQGKRVMVTGAGGSIGSELSRQIAQYNPQQLVLFDHSEFNLFHIDQELHKNGQTRDRIVAVLGDIKDRDYVNQIMAHYRPEIIFHAAAYKHVPLVEVNPCYAILNNVWGTQNLVEAALEFNCQRFVLISSDKAVNPVGVMGATKRACEMLVSSYAQQSGREFCSVRFGNVIGSSGSLVPQLEKQIHNGEPITLTHPDMQRFFMTCAEAVTLVLQAATISRPSDIALFKMGEPVKIVDIAESLIALLGKTVKEVPIVFSGIRPGEKMFEELYLTGRETETSHPDIVIVPKGDQTHNLTHEFVNSRVREMVQLARAGDLKAVDRLYKLAQPEKLSGEVGSVTDINTPKSP